MATKGNWPLCEHGRPICSQCIEVDDSGRRVSEAVGLAVAFHPFSEIIHSFMAFALADGNTDHVLYPSKNAAIDHQHGREQLYAFICLKNFPGGVKPKDAQLMLNLHRYAYDQGGRFADRDSPSLIMPQGREQMFTRKTHNRPGELD